MKVYMIDLDELEHNRSPVILKDLTNLEFIEFASESGYIMSVKDFQTDFNKELEDRSIPCRAYIRIL